MSIKKIEGKDKEWVKVRDTLCIAKRACAMRSQRLGLAVEMSVAELARSSIEMVYEAELAFLQAQEEKKIFFEVRELS